MNTSYTPPPTSIMIKNQNKKTALTLLLLQRRLYSKAKLWGSWRLTGVLLIGLTAPVVATLVPDLTVAVAVTSAVWIFLSRTIFASKEKKYASKAATIQEEFDLMVYDMPSIGERGQTLTLEDRDDILGDTSTFLAQINKERLKNWYPFDSKADGTLSVAVAQRANAVYTERLLRSSANALLILTIMWLMVFVVVSLIQKISLANFLLGIFLPLLPALLDNYENWKSVRSAGNTRLNLAIEIQDTIDDLSLNIDEKLMVWQNELYNLRIVTPNIPNLVYKAARKKNEKAMNAAASNLIDTYNKRSR